MSTRNTQRVLTFGLVLTLTTAAIGLTAAAPSLAQESAASNTTAPTSTKDHGVVSVVPAPTLSDGRLILKVVAFNRTRMMSSFGPDDVKVFTVAGEPVPLLSLDQLILQARGGSGEESADHAAGYNPSAYTGPVTTYDQSGRPNVTNYTGGGHGMDTITTPSSRPREKLKSEDDPQVKEQIAALKAAILHPVTVSPASAEGGQLVTQKLKLGRKEPHALRVVVDFNGEQHEFNFPVPPEK